MVETSASLSIEEIESWEIERKKNEWRMSILVKNLLIQYCQLLYS